jgi:hypothetical protein
LNWNICINRDQYNTRIGLIAIVISSVNYNNIIRLLGDVAGTRESVDDDRRVCQARESIAIANFIAVHNIRFAASHAPWRKEKKRKKNKRQSACAGIRL